MRRWPVIFLLALMVSAGCRSAGDEDVGHPEGRHEHDEDTAEHQGEPTEAAGDSLHIDPEMLRDLRLTTAVAKVRAGGEGASLLGELNVNEDTYAEVGSLIAARVVSLVAAPGDVVRAGDPLVELQSRELGQARGTYLAAQGRARLARHNLARKRQLGAERIVARREVQEAEATAAAAEADLKAARAELYALGVSPDGPTTAGKDDLSRFTILAPLGGTVIERAGVLGQLADPARPLFRIADLSRLWLIMHAFERDAVRVKAGAAVRVAFAALPARVVPGTVALVGRQVDPTSRTVSIRVEVPNPDGVLRPGMSATGWVALSGETGTVVAVPSAALQRLRDGWHVFVPRAHDAFEMRQVGRGRDLGEEVEIVSGLRAGETVIVEGAFLLKAEAEKSHGGGEHHEH